MNITTALRSGQPLIWMPTKEIPRVVDDIITQTQVLFGGSDTSIYYTHGLEGLLQITPDKKLEVWGTFVEETSGPVNAKPIFQSDSALLELINKKSNAVLIMTGTAKLLEGLTPFMIELARNYRESFKNNEIYTGLRICFIAPHDETIPSGLIDLATYVETETPDAPQMSALISYLVNNLEVKCDDEAHLVRASLGLTESEFIRACLKSIDEHGMLNAQAVENTRKENFKRNSMIDVGKPKLTLDDIGGLDYAKKLIKHMAWAQLNREDANKLDIPIMHKILLVGVPGTGKSAICEATASELNQDLARIGMGKVFDKFIGESERKAREMFKQLKIMSPIVAWIDEYGRDIGVGDYQGDAGTSSRVQAEFLTNIQELEEDTTLMMAANRIDQLSPEILRAGRVDKILFVGFPTHIERLQILRVHLGTRYEEFDLEKLAERTITFTGAEIKGLIRETKVKVSIDERRPITTDDLTEEIPKQRNRQWIRHADSVRVMYETAVKEWDWASTEQKDEADQVLHALKSPVRTSENTSAKARTLST